MLFVHTRLHIGQLMHTSNHFWIPSVLKIAPQPFFKFGSRFITLFDRYHWDVTLSSPAPFRVSHLQQYTNSQTTPPRTFIWKIYYMMKHISDIPILKCHCAKHTIHKETMPSLDKVNYTVNISIQVIDFIASSITYHKKICMCAER